MKIHCVDFSADANVTILILSSMVKPHVTMTYSYKDICEKPSRKISERTVGIFMFCVEIFFMQQVVKWPQMMLHTVVPGNELLYLNFACAE